MFENKSSKDIKKLKKIFLSKDSYKTLEEELNMNEKINNYKWTYDEIDKILSNSTKDNIEQSLVKIGKLLQQKINALKSLKQLQLNNIKSMEFFKKRNFKKLNKQYKESFLEKYEKQKDYFTETDQLLINALDQKELYMRSAENFLVLGYISYEDLKGIDTTGFDPDKNNIKINIRDIQHKFKNN
tara:strand:- start:1320 stop:1874 length:555 start_codon:yes stop_codon:yes gene_type:complete